MNKVRDALRTRPVARRLKEAYENLQLINKSHLNFVVSCMSNLHVTTVLDIGANVGQFAIDIRRYGFNGLIESLEPAQDSYNQLKINSLKDKLWNVNRLALGPVSGQLELNISGNFGLSSSFLEMKESHISNFPGSQFTRKEVVDVETLIHFSEKKKIDLTKTLLKIDVQGFEMDVLAGSGDLLNVIPLVLCEVSLSPLYEGEGTFFDVVNYLHGYGHEVISISRGVSSKDGRLLQVDLLFSNKDLVR